MLHHTLSSGRGWSVSYSALCHARFHILNLTHPVTVSIADSSWWNGEYIADPLHCLAIDRRQSAQSATHTLWHELGHALQCERDYYCDAEAYGLGTWLAYRKLFDDNWDPLCKVGDPDYSDWLKEYMSLPMEQEANEIADRYSRKYPLVKS